MTYVLIDEFAAIVQLGLADLLTEAGCDVVTGADFYEGVTDATPDVVIVDLDRRGSSVDAERLSIELPSATVIAVSPSGQTMRVFPPYHRGESYRTDLSPAQLVLAATGRPIG